MQGSKAAPKIDVAFVENRGQWDARAQYLAQMPGLNLWVTGDGVVYDFHQFVPNRNSRPGPHNLPLKGVTYGDAVKMTFVGAKPALAFGKTRLAGTFNYFRRGQNQTYTHIQRFDEVSSREMYNGITARYYFDQGMPRYDLIVKPGANPNQVQMRLEGARSLQMLPNGNLRIDTPMGPVEEKGLTVYQRDGSNRRLVSSRMRLSGNLLSFELGSYDASKELVIDPVLSSTYIGGSGGTGDVVTSVAYNAQQQGILAAGNATSPNFPVTLGTYQNFNTSSNVGFLANFSGATLNWCSYIEGVPTAPGSSYINIVSVLADANGGGYVAGNCYDMNLPTTSSSYQRDPVNSFNEGFIFALNSSGTLPTYCTYLGTSSGSTYVDAFALSTSGFGLAIIAGQTVATNLPTKPQSFQQVNPAGSGGADGSGFVAAFDTSLSSLQGCTYLGGSGVQSVTALTLDKTFNIWATGTTSSRDFPTTANVYQVSTSTSGQTGFVSCLTYDCTSLLASSYLGGSTGELVSGIDVGPSGNIAIAGTTLSADFPTAGGVQGTYPGHPTGFVSLLSSDLTVLQHSTFFGAPSKQDIYVDRISGIKFDTVGDLAVCGYTYNGDFPTTLGAYQMYAPVTPASFVSLLNWDLSSVAYSTFFGANDNALSLSIDTNTGTPYTGIIVGGSAGLVPVTYTASQKTNKGGSATNGFVSEILATTETIKAWASIVDGIYGPATDPMAVYLSSVAPPWGAKVSVHSDNPAVTVPSSVTVISGAVEGDFSAKILPVSATTTATIKFTYQGLSTIQQITVVPNEVSSLSFASNSVVGGNSGTGMITLGGPAGAGSGLSVHLSSSNPAVQVPAIVVVPANQTKVTFPITTSGVSASTPVTIQAYVTVANAKKAVFTVTPASLTSISAAPIHGGLTELGTVSLNGKASAQPIIVSLSSSNPLVQVPPTVTIPAGKALTTFNVVTSGVNSTTVVTLNAKVGATIVHTLLTVNPAVLAPSSITPASVVGGTSATGTVKLLGKAGPAGVVVKLHSDTLSAVVPATVTVPANASSATFVIKTTAVSAALTAHITLTPPTGSAETLNLSITK